MLRPTLKRVITSRIFLMVMACSLLGFALTFVSTASTLKAHAAVCIDNSLANSPVYDSYNHLEGWINLEQDPCNNNGVAGAFFGNNNTWKTVTVYVEYTNVYGFKQSPTTGWSANAGVWSPFYYGSNCYYAEVDLVDNRGHANWVPTSSVCV